MKRCYPVTVLPTGEGGFSLMEMLVAVVLVGMTLTVFLQAFSGSLRLSGKGRDLVERTILADTLFSRLLQQDVRDVDFPWQGEDADGSWRVELWPLQLQPPPDSDADVVSLQLPAELYQLLLIYQPKVEPPQQPVILRTVRRWPRNHFSEDFKQQHLLEPLPDEEL